MRAGGAGPSATQSNVLKALLLPHRLLQITGNQALANRPVEVAAFLFHYFHTPILSPLQHLKNQHVTKLPKSPRGSSRTRQRNNQLFLAQKLTTTYPRPLETGRSGGQFAFYEHHNAGLIFWPKTECPFWIKERGCRQCALLHNYNQQNTC